MAKLADELLLRAAKSGSSDIHIEPGEDELMVRFRIDGVLQRVVSLPMSFHPGIIAVLKARAGMDMFERTIPLDGRISLTFADRVSMCGSIRFRCCMARRWYSGCWARRR
jgi:type II secretory ATPase GspE/PulE/Tfp pilus assembly ATPase PilB-like protein